MNNFSTMFESKACENFTVSLYLPIQSAVISMCLSVVALPANLIILTIIWSMNRRQRTPFYLFVTNIALADLVVGAITDPISFHFHLREALGLNPDSKVIHLTYFIPCTASVFGLAALTVDRGIAVRCPSLYRFRLSPKRVIVSSISIWLSSIGLSLIYLNVNYILYSFVFAHVAVFVTCFFLGFVYVSVFTVLKKRAKVFEEYSSGEPNSHQRKQNIRDRKIANLFLTILMVFVICYGPSCLAIYIMYFCTECSCGSIEWLRDYALLLVLLNSSINPVIFIYRMPYFRHFVWKLLKCKKSEVYPRSCVSTQEGQNDNDKQGNDKQDNDKQDNDKEGVGKIKMESAPEESGNQIMDEVTITCQNERDKFGAQIESNFEETTL